MVDKKHKLVMVGYLKPSDDCDAQIQRSCDLQKQIVVLPCRFRIDWYIFL